jgi:two-component system chemotaxis response regulator CheY
MQAARPLRFLIVEHVAAMRTLLRDLLKSLGYPDAAEVESAVAALEKLREAAFDFVVADLDMPGDGAIELLRQLRADAKLARLPVLLVADRATKESVLAAAQAGASGCLVKPFTPAALQARIDRIVDRAPATA